MSSRRQQRPPEPQPSPFTSGTVTVGYPFDADEQRQLDELERLAEREEGADEASADGS